MNDVTNKKESLDRIADSLEEIQLDLSRIALALEDNGGVIPQGGGTPLPPGVSRD